MNKWYLKHICRKLINGATRSIGLEPVRQSKHEQRWIYIDELLTNAAHYPIFIFGEYSPPNEACNASHVVVGNGRFTVYEYSSDIREQRCSTYEFSNFIEIAKYCAESQINAALRILRSKDKNYRSINDLVTENEIKQWFDLQKKHEEYIKIMLNSYLIGVRSRMLNWQINMLLRYT